MFGLDPRDFARFVVALEQLVAEARRYNDGRDADRKKAGE